MNSQRNFDLLLRSWLDESAPAREPDDLLEAVLVATRHSRPRPAWLVRLGGEPMLEQSRAGLHRMAPLALAATVLVVTLMVGIGLLVRWPNVGPPSVPTATAVPSADTVGTWTTTASMMETREGHTATLLPDGTVLAAGGASNPTAELYDPRTRSWAPTGDMGEVRHRHTATLLPDGTVLVAGGRGSDVNSGSGPAMASAELYDPSDGSWATTGGMTDPRIGHTATLLTDGSVLATGGYDAEGQLLASAELYDPQVGSWTPTGSMVVGHTYHVAALLADGAVLVTGGADASGGPELYDPETGGWTAFENPPYVAYRNAEPTATLLPDGTVLIAGGEIQASAARYDPRTRTFSVLEAMSEPRVAHQATLLPDGTVLVTGGLMSTGGTTGGTSAELFDPATGTWSAAAPMAGSRRGHTATLLGDGTVLVVGGRSAQLYGPGTGN